MIHALVFDTDTPFLAPGQEASTVPASTRLAGLTLLRRAILAGWKAGAEKATVIVQDAGARERWTASEVGLPIPVSVVAADAPLPVSGTETCLVLSAQVLPFGSALSTMLSRAQGEAVRLADADGKATGPAVVPGAELAGRDAAAVGALLRSGCAPLSLPPTSHLRIATAEDLRPAERLLYRNLVSSADGYLDRKFNRYISGWFTRRIIDLPITPNQVTAIHFTMGMVAVGLFWHGCYWLGVLGALLLQLSVALDCSDGEVARLKYQFSKLGGWLDLWADNVVHMALFAAIARSAAGNLGTQTSLTLGALAVAGVLMCILVIFSMAKLQSRRGEASTLSATNRLSENQQASSEKSASVVDKIINEATSRDFTAIVVVLALFGKLEWMAWLAGIGSHVFWVVFGLVQLSLFQSASSKTATP